MKKIPLSFYQHEDVVSLSRELLGKYLCSQIGTENIVTGGMIIETEAYCGATDKASHAYKNRRTQRTEVMFSEGGVAYVYLCYGMHHLFNVITNTKDVPHAILIRALKPEMGIELMLKRRNQTMLKSNLTSGPGSVCQALGINKTHNGSGLTNSPIWLEDRGVNIDPNLIQASPRIGIDYAEEDALQPWRFRLISSKEKKM